MITYATWAGSAEEVAQYVGKVLNQNETDIDVLPVNEVQSLEEYSSVIVGTAIHASKVHPEVQKFLKKNSQILQEKPVAYYIVCLTMKDDTEENRETVLSYLDDIRSEFPEIHPVDIGLFAGKMDYKKLSFTFKLIVRAMNIKEGDYRDWEVIREWAADVKTKLFQTD